MAESVKLFLSCVSDEFGTYRDELRSKLTRPNVHVKIQEDFKALGGDTLQMLEDYIAQCEAVVHFVGEMSGSSPAPASVEDLLTRRPDLGARLAGKGMSRDAFASLTYTQWEAWLAIGFGKNLLIVEPAEGVAREAALAPTDASRASQALHLKRLHAIDRYPGPPFTSVDNLVAQLFGSAVIDALVKAAAKPAGQPRNLPFASMGRLFVGRDKALGDLRQQLLGARGAAIAGRALHGLGGIGKTRLAVEYAWGYAGDYSALLFVRADGEAALSANLAALAGPEVIDLPEKESREDAVKIRAVVRWLEAHPTWLMILDNVDEDKAVAAVSGLMPRFKGGHVIVTGRASNFPASLPALELDVIDEGPATQFLLERTRGKRVEAADDETRARDIARELGGLALGLEQAGAYITKLHMPFARYEKIWSEKRQKALAWSDATPTGSEKTLATTWVTSVEQLSPESLRLLDRLAMLAQDPIPGSLFDVPSSGEAPEYDAYEASAGLADYSLIAQAKSDEGAAKGFVVHRLVQDFARRAMSKARRAEALSEALEWVNEAFAGDPQDVRSWPILDPLAPHALAVVGRADEAGIAEAAGRLWGRLGMLFSTKARYAEAERLTRRALAIGEVTLQPDDPELAMHLNNLAVLLRQTNRLTEAERLMRRALAISEVSLGRDHSDVASSLANLALLLEHTNRLGEAEPLVRRALAIREKIFGPDHPDVAHSLNNLGSLLQTANRFAEAEPLYRRALAACERSFGMEHPYVAICLSNLAALLQATSRRDEAEPLIRRALAIDEASYGPDHPDVARDLNNLAQLLQDTNRLSEAEPLIRRALAIDEASLGLDHSNVAIRLNNLAQLLRQTNRLAEAEPLYRRALAICEKSLGADHPNTVTVRENLFATLMADPGVTALLAELEQAGSVRPAKKGFLSRLFGRR